MNINVAEYRQRVLGCWLGKNIGGTIGAPMEWKRQVNDVSFYTQELGGEPLPNDDLDIQLLWLVAMEEKGTKLDAHILADYWLTYVTPHWAEYGICKSNLRNGLLPPLSGTFGNTYKDSCGAFIRSEIWACVCPGSPRLAAKMAYEDAIIDHGNGEGTYAEVFCAAIEAAAFVEHDLRKLIDIGLTYIPTDCAVADVVKFTIECHQSGITWLEARNQVLKYFRGGLWVPERKVLEEDKKRGWPVGRQGFDVPSNIGMLLIGLLYGEGDFAKTICTAVNCGEDTDCTAATAGSIFGIIYGAKAIPQKWISPIGRKIKTACLNLGELGYFGNQLPADVDILTERTLTVAQRVASDYGTRIDIGDAPTDLKKSTEELGSDMAVSFYIHMNGPKFPFPFFEVSLDYGQEGPMIRAGQTRELKMRLVNQYKYQTMLNVHWYLPEGLVVENGIDTTLPVLQPNFGEPPVITWRIRCDAVHSPVIRAAVEFTQPGRASVMHVPVTFLHMAV